LENDVYFQIGLVTLVGLAAKNAILIVEFAVLRHREGLSIREAAIDAARLRLRPIIMTSLAFIFGMVPMFIAGGAGANSRHSVATGIIGGMIIASSIALFFIPMFFYLIERSGERFASAKKSSAKVPPGTGKNIRGSVGHRRIRIGLVPEGLNESSPVRSAGK
jgi:multidrug efflux pump